MSVYVQALAKSYGNVKAADNVSFEVPHGSFTTLLGPSGAGKTSILRCIAGVERPDKGTIKIGGKTVFSAEAGVNLPPEQRSIGMVYQSYALWPHMTVFENVAYPLKVRKTNLDAEAEVGAILGTLGIKDLKFRHPSQLSGGEQQRVALARALIYRPEVVLLDEPFSNLDTPLRERLRDELKLIQREFGFTTVYVTHHRIEATSMSDQVVVLFGGRVSGIGAPEDLLEHPPNSQVAAFLCGFLVLRGEIRRKRDDGLVIHAPEGEVLLPGLDGGKEGEKLSLFIRPHLVRLVTASGLLGIVKGRIVGLIRETSSEVSYNVQLGDQRIRVPRRSTDNWAPGIGDYVGLEVPPGAFLIARE